MDSVRRLLENALTVTEEQRVREDIEAALSLLEAHDREQNHESGDTDVDEPGTQPVDMVEETD